MITGVGTDIIEIARIRQAVDKWGSRFLDRIFNPQEIAYAQSHALACQHFSGRFAAKEAVYKALGDRTISWKDITVTNDDSGRPLCRVTGLSPGKTVHLSISHSKYYAVANAIVETR
jgi:holo-[acyl-carrier protein] synthase